MKHTIFLFLLFLPLLAFSQKKSPAKKDLPKTALNVPKQQYSFRDFEYSFFPESKYAMYTSVMAVDSATKVIAPKVDSVGHIWQSRVKKEGDRLTVQNLADLSTPFYSEAVKFVGVSNDGANTLIYEAKTQAREMVAVNPLLGYVIVGFKFCDKKAKSDSDCDLQFHYFGNVPFRKYAP